MQKALQGFITSSAFKASGMSLGALSNSLKETATKFRLTGAGGMLKNLRTMYKQGRIQKVADFIKNEKLLRVGDTVETVIKRVEPIINKTGQQLDDLYRSINTKFNDSKFLQRLTPAQQERYLNTGFYPSSQKNEILKSIWSEIKDEPSGAAALKQMDTYLEQLVEEYGDDITIRKANDIKSKIDSAIRYSRIPTSPEPIKEKALFKLRTIINDKIKAQMDFVDEVIGGDAGKQLRRLNERYSNAATVQQMAADKAMRETTNRFWGISEQIGSNTAAAAAFIQSGDPVTAAMVGAGAYGASRAMKKAGPGAGAFLSDVLQKGTEILSKGGDKLATPMAATDAKRPVTGPAAWQAKGVERLIDSTNDYKYGYLRDSNDTRIQELLIKASALRPDSKGFKKIKSELDSILSKQFENREEE